MLGTSNKKLVPTSFYALGVFMQIDHHPLATEFPDFKDAIHHLKLNSAHFAKLFDEYDHNDKAITRAENGVEHLGDAALETLKKHVLYKKTNYSNCCKRTQTKRFFKRHPYRTLRHAKVQLSTIKYD